MKSMLQQLDTNLFSIDGLIEEQHGKLADREKLISNNQAEIERLEKRTKMQEHKVKKQTTIAFWCITLLFSFVLMIVPTSHIQIDILQKTTKVYEEDKRSLRQELETREQRLQRELTDKRRMEQRLNGVVTDTQFKWEKECVSRPVSRLG